MRFTVVLLAVLSAACVADPAPKSCRKEDRVGAYLTSFDLVSGNCGPIRSQLIRLTGDDGVDGCVVESETWSENDCKLEREVTCTSEGSSRLVAVTRQTTEDGSRIEGVYSIWVSLSDGSYCSGTYNMTSSRQ
jgi:hypothetical protein